MNHQTPPKDFDFEKHMRSLDRRRASEAAVHLICAGLVRKGKDLETGQKVDIVNAMLDMHRSAIIAEFLRVLTGDYDLMTGGDDAEKEKKLRQGVAHAILAVEPKTTECSERLMTLALQLFPDNGDAPSEAPECVS